MRKTESVRQCVIATRRDGGREKNLKALGIGGEGMGRTSTCGWGFGKEGWGGGGE